MEQQDITSKGTSTNKLAKFYKLAYKADIITNGKRVYDYGAGKYIQHAIAYGKDNGFDVVCFDPYNLPKEYNDISFMQLRNVDMVCCNNVLNVLTDDSLHTLCCDLHTISYLYKLPIYITVYEGNGSGIGKLSKKDCYQRNDKARDYVAYLEKYFPIVVFKNGIIRCTV